MRELTYTEKEHLERKIQDERKRQQTLRMNPNRPNAAVGTEFTLLDRLNKYGLLAAIFCLIAFSVVCLLEMQEGRNLDYDDYGVLIVSLALLFNHIAHDFTKTGWKSWVMKTVSRVWIVLILAYLLWINWGSGVLRLFGR